VAHLLGTQALHLEFPTKAVFDSVTVGVSDGDRIGIVGRNGDGKSSLLAMLSGRLAPNAGRVMARNGVTIGLLDQGDTLDLSLTVARTIVGDRADHEWAGEARIRDVIGGSPWPGCWQATGMSWPWTSRPTTSTSRASPGWPGTCGRAGRRTPAGCWW
jgi:energy-coupling factor transporter ATP-binding protein EcfA2